MTKKKERKEKVALSPKIDVCGAASLITQELDGWTDTDLILVCIDRCIADRSPEACHWPRLTNNHRN